MKYHTIIKLELAILSYILSLWIKYQSKIYCPHCENSNYILYGSYQRIWDKYSYSWNVQRFKCNICVNRTFSLYSNTKYSNSSLPPIYQAFRILRLELKIIFYLQNVKNTQYVKQINFQIHSEVPATTIQEYVSEDFKNQSNYLLNCLNEKQRRLFTGLLTFLNLSTIEICKFTNISRKTIRKGKMQLLNRNPFNLYSENIRRPGAGRKSIVKDPELQHKVLQLVEPETAGDPISGVKWIRRSLRTLSKIVDISPSSVSKILRNNGYSLRVNSKKISLKGNQPDRDKQFKYIESKKSKFINQGLAVLSIDGKKKELIGNYKNNGKTWVKKPHETLDHDFPDQAEGILVPFGIYDLQQNSGFVLCGTNSNTSEFAVDSISLWWEKEGSLIYDCKEIYLLCDAGTPNSYRSHLWKWYLQMLSDRFDLIIHVSHYPSGTSKWNPIEHRLFSQISRNWQGIPLVSYETALNYIAKTSTETGLSVQSNLTKKLYEKSRKIPQINLITINIIPDEVCSDWNYKILPRNEQLIQNSKKLWEEKTIKNLIWHFSNKKFKTKKSAKEAVTSFLNENKFIFYKLSFNDYTNYRRKSNGGRGRPPLGSKIKFVYSVNIKYQSKI